MPSHGEESEVARLRNQLAKQEARFADLEAALRRERALTEEEREGREAALRQVAGLRRKLRGEKSGSSAEREVDRLNRELEKVYSSRTWRAGRVIWAVGTAPQRLAKRFGRAAPVAEDKPQRGVASSEPRPQPDRQAEYVLIEDTVMRSRYQDALDRTSFSNPDSSRNVVMTVYTDDLDEGRGDVFVAVGLGRYLERHGYEVIYLPRDRWYDIPEGASIYVAMLDWVDLTRLPTSLRRIAWIRNRTRAWADAPWLPLYDLVLCSSVETERAVRRVYPGPTGVLPLAVDAELFRKSGRDEDRAGVVTTQNHWGTERVAHQLLRERQPDFPLSLFGQDRGIDHSLSRHVRGPISFFALPSLYNQAAIVVDDLLAQNAPFGNTNSRLFEALACGAVTLTNQTLGRDALGLQAVPAYRNASELFDLIHAELDGADLRSTVKALHATILERHTYEYRAAEFIAHLDDTASQTRARRSAPTVIGFFPDYRDNPYQEMMWAQLRDEGAIPVGVDDGFDAVPLVKALSDHRLFHLSWTAPILGPARTEADRLARYRRFLSLLDTLDTARIPSIWTVHNVLPHECADPSMERSLRQEIADRVDLIHVMCERTASEVSADYQLPAGKVRVVPHPSYIDVYPNLIDQDTARYELGLHPDEMTYLFFGQVRDYKGVDLLLDSFERLHRHRPRSRLIIAGQPGRFPGRPEIEQRARAHPAIISHLHSIGDADVQLYMNAADVVVLPYRQVLNSGAMMLAFSFARPVITAAAGCIPETFDDTTGITFSWDDGEAALYRTMLEGERLRDEGYRHAAYRAAGRHHYREASRAFAELAEEAWAQRGIATT